VAGLKAPVSVTRDRAGTPCIHADDLEDLFFAQGYVTAQDRLFQMDTGRRYAAGELSEIIGFPLVRARPRRASSTTTSAALSSGAPRSRADDTAGKRA